MVLQWNPPDFHQQNGDIQHYLITLTTTDVENTLTSTDTILTIQDLHPFYIYTFSVRAVTIGSGPEINITFQMLEDSMYNKTQYKPHMYIYFLVKFPLRLQLILLHHQSLQPVLF